MRFENPWLLLLLLLLIPLLLQLIRLGKRRLKRFSTYADTRFFDHYFARLSPFYFTLKLVLLLVSFAFLVIALARPQWDYQTEEINTASLDIIFAIDVSRSMDATDLSPSRLWRAKLQVSSLIQELKGDRVGIIAFAGSATLECPLTTDYAAAQMVLNSLNTNMAVRLGTDIGAALDLAERSFNSGQGNNILVLISDGEDLEGSAVTTARRLKGSGITIYTMGVGSESGTRITNPETGEEVVSSLDVSTLRRIADAGGGSFFLVSPGQSELSSLLTEIYGKERSRTDGRLIHRYKEQYALFVAIALLFLVIEVLINPYRKEPVK